MAVKLDLVAYFTVDYVDTDEMLRTVENVDPTGYSHWQCICDVKKVNHVLHGYFFYSRIMLSLIRKVIISNMVMTNGQRKHSCGSVLAQAGW